MTVTNAFTSLSTTGLIGGKTLTISISTVRNLPMQTPVATFAIYTADASGNYIDECSGLSVTLS